ncbi:MAG TPA: energy transducer TonB [Abditibacteriaceae bacterium]
MAGTSNRRFDGTPPGAGLEGGSQNDAAERAAAQRAAAERATELAEAQRREAAQQEAAQRAAQEREHQQREQREQQEREEQARRERQQQREQQERESQKSRKRGRYARSKSQVDTPEIDDDTAQAMRRKMVRLRAVITVEGKAEQIEVLQSSGIPAFDRSCIESVKRGRHSPKMINGEPVASTAKFAFSVTG